MHQLTRLAAVATTAALAFAATATAASAADRYIAPGGADAADCTNIAAPCGTWNYTQGQAAGGDTVNFAAGTYPPATYNVTKALTLKGAQAGTPAPGRSGDETELLSAGGSNWRIIVNAAGVTIDGFTLAPTPASPLSAIVTNVADTTVANTRILGSSSAGFTNGVSVSGGATLALRDSSVQATDFGVYAGGDTAITGSALAAGRVAINQWQGNLTATSNTLDGTKSGAQAIAATGTGTAELHGNRFASTLTYGVFAPQSSERNFADNWWGCNTGPTDPNAGPSTTGCLDTAYPAGAERYLVLDASASPTQVTPGSPVALNAAFERSDGSANPYALPPVTDVSYTTTFGTLTQASAPVGGNTSVTASTIGDGTVGVTLDNQTLTLPFKVRTPGLTIDPASHDFGDVAVGQSSGTQSITVTDGSGAPIRIRSVSLSGADADQFVLFANACRTTLDDLGSCTLTTGLRPTRGGPLSAAIVVLADGLDPISIPLTGTGANSFRLSIGPGSLDFHAVSAGGSSGRQTVTLTNTASTPTTISSITSDSGEFVLSAAACRTTLAPSATCTISAVLKPQATGLRYAIVSVRVQGASSQTMTMSGTGVAPALTISPDDGRFGTVAVGKPSSKRTFTITNNGETGAPVDVQSLSLTGANAGEFVLYAGSCAKHTLAVGESCDISALLRPTSVGSKAAQISVNASGQPVRTIALSGNGG